MPNWCMARLFFFFDCQVQNISELMMFLLISLGWKVRDHWG